MLDHKQKLGKIAGQMVSAAREHRKLRIFHGFSHTTRELNYQENEVIDISALNNILEINVEGKYALVEPNVTMQVLVEKTMDKGLVPLVVPELPKITLGGSVQGGAGESSSFKYGGVHNICDEYEIVLGNGEIVTASKDVNPDLFWGLPCSYGSLGITTLVKIRLTEAKKFVKLSYLPVGSFLELNRIIKEQREQPIDFVDAILFGPNSGVVMVGIMVNEPDDDDKVMTFSGESDEWFYLYVQSKVKKQNFVPDHIPLKDYLFRYNQGAFWTGKLVFDKLKIPFTKLSRTLLYKRLNAESLGKAVHSVNNSQSGICQDFCLSQEKLTDFLDYLNTTLSIYPLWICPLMVSKENDKLSPTNINSEQAVNVGMYAKFDGGYNKFVAVNRALEQKLAELGGRKVLYAHQYYSPEEFWKIYDLDWYNKLRNKYFANNVFPDIYEKTNVNKKYQTKVLKTVLSFLGLSKH